MKHPFKRSTKKLILFVLVVFSLQIGCNKKPSSDQNNHLTIDLSAPGSTIFLPLTEIAEDIQMTQLETRNDCLVSHFRGFAGKKHIICFERNNVLHFTSDGTFIGEIMRAGQGPGEFYHIGAWDVDESERFLIIYDSNKDFIYRYDLDKGEFVTPIKNVTPTFADAMQFLNDSMIALLPSVYSNSEHHYLIYSLNGDVSKGPKREVLDNPRLQFTGISADFRKTKSNNIVYRPRTSDTIYQINETEMTPLFVPIIEKKRQSGNVTEGEYTEHIYLSEDYLYLYKNQFKHETNSEANSISITMSHGNFYVINLKTREIFDSRGLSAKYLGVSLPLWRIFPSGGNRFNFSVSAMDFIESIDRGIDGDQISPEDLEFITQLRKSISEEDNPIIFSGTFKENIDLSHLK
ncbi:6-bladed beta-propeller [Natronoflexus pectinivorans]|uniref:6-bladed beta-propeller protein n=1 Tax=Natronoflexus pectinivorans TaxID=682526 RepID=A0A4R2GJD6_9BACT|nr:6-bladed beta-propeller [Natronoflexus pectinivorans]TCO08832.1 6-bladed beta-propeller protein [Natronoflexus pectinivorans]